MCIDTINVNDNYGINMDEVNMAVVAIDIHPPVNTDNPETMNIDDIIISMTTEKIKIITLPPSICKNGYRTLDCKVDIGTGGIVM